MKVSSLRASSRIITTTETCVFAFTTLCNPNDIGYAVESAVYTLKGNFRK